MSKLLLVRHGTTTLNDVKRFWGKTDVELSPEGVNQAERLRDRLSGEKIDAIYASNLCRARTTAKIIASKHRLGITTRDELAEINFGWVEGLTFDEITTQYPELSKELKDWKAKARFPGGESLDELDCRLQIFLEFIKKHKPEETVLVVAHFGTLRLIVCNLLGIGLEHWLQIRIEPCSLSIMETFPQGAILSLLNDVSHLSTKEP